MDGMTESGSRAECVGASCKYCGEPGDGWHTLLFCNSHEINDGKESRNLFSFLITVLASIL